MTRIRLQLKELVTAALPTLARLLPWQGLAHPFDVNIEEDNACTPDHNIRLLLLHLCSGDHARALWVMRWLAYPLRNPGVKMSSALVIHGGPGTGKSIFFEDVMGRIHATHAEVVNDFSSVRFNGQLIDKHYVVVDQPMSHRDISLAKVFLTNNNVVFHRKWHATAIKKNTLNFVFISSELDWTPNQPDDRRYLVLQVPRKRQPDLYSAVGHEIKNCGVVAFMLYLTTELDMGDFNQFTPIPQHRSKAAA